MLQFGHLVEDCNIFHFTTTRHTDIGELPIPRLILPHQIHEDKILPIDEGFLHLSEEVQTELLDGVDALITDLPDVCIGVKTADCVPVTLYAPDKGVVAVVHAGWRGTVLQIVAKTVERMVTLYNVAPLNILAGIGPSIGQEAFEVGEEVVEAFARLDMDFSQICERNDDTGRAHIDLWEVNRLQLINAGLSATNIEVAELCTYSCPDDFYSARRSGIKCGRMISGIMIKPTV